MQAISEEQPGSPVASKSEPRATVIVVSYNTRDMTLAALRSLFAETETELIDVVVVDNASSDGSAAAISNAFPDIRLIALQNNIGFARANNLAAAEARGRYILLLNPDTVTLDKGIDRLIAFADSHRECRIWGGRTLFADRTLNKSSCWGEMTPWSLFCLASGLKALFPRTDIFDPEGLPSWNRDSIRNVDIVSGCLLLIERTLWQRLGGFDTDYFMYGEDADLCLRARRYGATPMICPQATIVHYGGASEPVRSDKLVRLLKARVTLMKDHWPASRRRLGRLIFQLFPLPRLIGYYFIGIVLGKPSGRREFEAWYAIWKARGEWLEGYEKTGR